MQCRNCGFENLPGLTDCARCASVLDLSAIAIEPPRSSHWPLAGALQSAHFRVFLAWRSWRWPRWRIWNGMTPEPLDMGTLGWALLLPGMGQIRTGRRVFGAILLWTWLALWLLVLVSLGTPWQSLFFMMLVPVHALGVLEVFAANLCWERFLWRALFGLVIWAALFLGLYRPMRWLGGRFALFPTIHGAAGGVLADGDGLVVTGPWLQLRRYRVGDIVLYEIPASAEGGYFVRGGQGCDRVVAGPGDHLVISRGQIQVNGSVPPANGVPLGALPQIDFDYTPGTGQYVVLPSLLRVTTYGDAGLYTHLLREISLVSETQIVGRVVYRLRPFARMGRLDQE